jgi:ribosomal protein S27E
MEPILSEEDIKILENESYSALKTILKNGCKICGSETVEFSSNLELTEGTSRITKSWFLEIECVQCKDKYIHVMEMKTDDRNENNTTNPDDREDRHREN